MLGQVLGQYVCELMLSRTVLELYLVGCQVLSCVVVPRVNVLGLIVGVEVISVCQCYSRLVIFMMMVGLVCSIPMELNRCLR